MVTKELIEKLTDIRDKRKNTVKDPPSPYFAHEMVDCMYDMIDEIDQLIETIKNEGISG